MATPSHVDLSVLWVPIMPETSKLGPAMEDAGKSATESFDKGSAGIGEKLHDKVSHATDKLKDVFHRAGHDAGDAMSDGVKAGTDAIEKAADESAEKTSHKFRDAFTGIGKGVVGAIGPDVQRELSNRLEDVVGGAFKSTFGGDGYKGRLSELAGQGIATVFNFELDDLRQKLSDTKDAVGQTRSAFADLTGGNTLAGVQGLTTAFKMVGLTAADLPKPLQDAVGKMDDAKQTIGGVSDIFTALPGKVGQFGSALSGLAGPLAVVAASVPVFSSIRDSIRDIGDAHPDLHWLTQLAAPDQDSPWDSHAPLRKLWNWLTGHKDGGPSGSPLPPNSLLGPSGVDDMLLGGGQGGGGGFDSLFGGGRGAGGGFDSLFGGGTGIGGAAGTDWDAVHQHEASSWDTNTGNGYYGGLQFDDQTWKDFGGTDFAPRADLATPDQQKIVANRVPVSQRAQRWPNTYQFGAGRGGGGGGGGFGGGGGSYGLPAGTDVRQGAAGFPPWVYALGQQFGLQASTYAGHQETERPDIGAAPNPQHLNRGIDWWGTQENMDRFAAFLQQTGLAEQVIHQDPNTGQKFGFPANVDYSGNYGEETTMVHTRFSHAPDRGSGSAGLGSVGAPTGAQHDPIYTAQADSAGGGAGAGQSQGQQLGQGLVDGLMQAVGLDGSVFKGFGGSSNPLHFGITKLATGLANVFGGMIQGQGGAAAGGLGGGGGGIPGLSMLSGLGALPSGGIPQGPGGAQNVPSGDTTIHNGPVNYGPQLTVTQNGGGLSPTEELQQTANGASNRLPALGPLPNSGTGLP